MKAFELAIFVVCFWQIVCSEKARFDNYRIYSVNIENDEQLNVLHDLQIYPDGISFRAMPMAVGQNIDLVIPPHKFGDVFEIFETYKFNYRIKVENFQKYFI